MQRLVIELGNARRMFAGILNTRPRWTVACKLANFLREEITERALHQGWGCTPGPLELEIQLRRTVMEWGSLDSEEQEMAPYNANGDRESLECILQYVIDTVNEILEENGDY